METVQFDGYRFSLLLSEKTILKRIEELSREIEARYNGSDTVFICVLNGGFTFSAELMRNIQMDYELKFVKVKSYDGIRSSDTIKEILKIDSNLEGRRVVILEDIVETGLTTHYLINRIRERNPDSVAIATLLYKPGQVNYPDLPIEHIGFEINKEFVIGFGLDINEKARNLRSIYKLVEEK